MLHKMEKYREEGERGHLSYYTNLVVEPPLNAESIDYQTDNLSTDCYKSLMTFPQIYLAQKHCTTWPVILIYS